MALPRHRHGSHARSPNKNPVPVLSPVAHLYLRDHPTRRSPPARDPVQSENPDTRTLVQACTDTRAPRVPFDIERNRATFAKGKRHDGQKPSITCVKSLH